MSIKKFLYDVTPFSKILSTVVLIALPFVGFWMGMQYGCITEGDDTIRKYSQIAEINPTTNNMKLTLKESETVTFEGLSISNVGGGHKILQAPGGGRGGDLSFAEIELKAEGVEPETVRVYTPEIEEGFTHQKIQFGEYEIVVEDVGWNGDPVILSVERVGQ